ncbi:MAG: hypothetical protein N2204_09025, partial [Anaerolineae bacterium]|nr:hypothetical protein [Anaerolineae bacterium]
SVQAAVAASPPTVSAFLEGPAGAGKTTAAVARLMALLRAGVPGHQVLVLLPQRTLAGPYTAALRKPSAPAGSEVTILTMGGLAQRAIELFWPLIAEEAGFGNPDRPPVFLTLETAQYFMARVVGPLLAEGYFDAIAVDRNRLYSQILDNLNKAAVVGFPHTEIGSRLAEAWGGESAAARVYAEAQECATRFRAYCLANNLLDFSLQYELFARLLWPMSQCREYLLGRYRHLIVDNVEEDTPVAHDILVEWLPQCTSALIVYDVGAGYRRFLGADPASAYRLKSLCGEHVTFTQSLVMSPPIAALSAALRRQLGPRPTPPAGPAEMGRRRVVAEDLLFRPAESDLSAPVDPPNGPEAEEPVADFRPAIDFAAHRFHPEMLDWVADEIGRLVHDEGVKPGQIAVLAPFLGGGLRFSLEVRLAARGIPARSHRPSRALREEPATVCLLTLAALSHPQWGIVPAKSDVAHALMLAIADMDLVRAQLLAEIAYRVRDGVPTLGPFSALEPEAQERITFLLGGRYEGLRAWLEAQKAAQRTAVRRPSRRRGRADEGLQPLDQFLSRLFGELLSQPGYGFHRDYDAGEVAAKVIESARKFREVMSGLPAADEDGRAIPLGREYMQLVQDGVVAAQYVKSWQRQPQDAVLLAPAYTFLMSNQAVDHQFWLDVGSTGWWERLYQPLTQPYVLSRRWPGGRTWTDLDEYMARQEALAALVLGLVRRCRVQIHLGLSELGEQGIEQRGPLLRAIQNVLRTASSVATR